MYKIGIASLYDNNDIMQFFMACWLQDKIANAQVYVRPLSRTPEESHIASHISMSYLTGDVQFDAFVLIDPVCEVSQEKLNILNEFKVDRFFVHATEGKLPETDAVLAKLLNKLNVISGAETFFSSSDSPINDIFKFRRIFPIWEEKIFARNDRGDACLYVAFELEDLVPLLDHDIGQSSGRSIIVTRSSTKSKLRLAHSSVEIYGLNEIGSTFLLDQVRVVIDRSSKLHGDLHKYLLLSAAYSEKILVVRPSLAKKVYPIRSIAGPENILRLFAWLDANGFTGLNKEFLITSNREFLSQAEWVEPYHAKFLKGLKGTIRTSSNQQKKEPYKTQKNKEKSIVFFPINGNGLGHAQRLVTIAKGLPKIPKKFLGFNTCLDFLTRHGMDVCPVVNRPRQGNDFSVEKINFDRMREVVNPDDLFVFDGGYPYDSVVAHCIERPGKNVQIRRGLFKASQNNRIALEREKFFDIILRPLEGLPELNDGRSSFLKDEITFDPIVSQVTSVFSKKDLLALFEKQFLDEDSTLIVSMLGGGYISDRSSLVKTIADEVESKNGVLHIAISWPQSSFNRAVSGYKKTKVITTNYGRDLIRAADLVICACGYNTFHEVLSERKPAIFIPQDAPWLDDQTKRATAAMARGLGVFVKENNGFLLRATMSKYFKSPDTFADGYKDGWRLSTGNEQVLEYIKKVYAES